MKSYVELPEQYRKILHIDLQKDKKLMLTVNILAVVIGIIMALAALPFVSMSTFFDSNDLLGTWIKLGAMYAGFVIYMVLHEAVHGVFMRRYSNARVTYGFTGMYAYAASEAYYCRRHYVVIALAPVVIWGIVLIFLNFLVPISWFYVVYFIQMGNISGAAGDLYVTWRMHKLPEDILIRDDGVAMTVYSAVTGGGNDGSNI